MSRSPPDSPYDRSPSWLQPGLDSARISLPKACRPGVRANSELIHRHWETLRRAAMFEGDDHG